LSGFSVISFAAKQLLFYWGFPLVIIGGNNNGKM
jgi:hypothetical protein